MFTRNIIVEKPVLFDVYAKELPCINIMHYIIHYGTAFVGRIFVSHGRKAWILLFLLIHISPLPDIISSRFIPYTCITYAWNGSIFWERKSSHSRQIFFHLSPYKRSVNINYDVDLNYEAGNLLRTLVNEGNKSLFAYSGTN